MGPDKSKSTCKERAVAAARFDAAEKAAWENMTTTEKRRNTDATRRAEAGPNLGNERRIGNLEPTRRPVADSEPGILQWRGTDFD